VYLWFILIAYYLVDSKQDSELILILNSLFRLENKRLDSSQLIEQNCFKNYFNQLATWNKGKLIRKILILILNLE
jgi:hypothetical protein